MNAVRTNSEKDSIALGKVKLVRSVRLDEHVRTSAADTTRARNLTASSLATNVKDQPRKAVASHEVRVGCLVATNVKDRTRKAVASHECPGLVVW